MNEFSPKVRPMPSTAEELGVLIKETQVALNQRMDRALRPLELTVPQYACLQSLSAQPGITSSELARRAFVSRQSMNVLLQGLEKRGLVDRSGEPGPRRERAVALTVDAQSLLAQAQSRVAAVVDAMVDGLGDDGQHQLLGLLAQCRDALCRE